MVRKYARKIATAAMDVLFPPTCLLCNADVAQAGLVCTDCFGRLHPIGAPCCDACATPQTAQAYIGADGLCPACERHHPLWVYARAAFLYDQASRDLILQLKYADRLENARFLANRMVQVGEDILTSDVVLVPVPVHRWRLIGRQYNQAAILAWALARRTGLCCVPDALVRRKATSRLANFSPQERKAEMVDAIAVHPGRVSQFAGRSVVLVDDVLTTGATATVCTQVLLDAGAASVSLLVAGRVPAQKEVDLDFPVMETTM
ncbi:competence protein ComF [Acetobacter malorum]|uniref:Competence protein ComF n=2 Tax=Acetobacter malorum TaxID=178901 RepID=A0A149RJF8_9PROT|nr:competence protein ComF [Acetobacter malorum]